MRWLFAGIGVVVAVLLEQGFLAGLTGLSSAPLDPIVLIAIFLTLAERRTSAVIFAGASGLLLDLSAAPMFGATPLRLLLVIATCHILMTEIFPHRSTLSTLILVVCGTVVFHASGFVISLAVSAWRESFGPSASVAVFNGLRATAGNVIIVLFLMPLAAFTQKRLRRTFFLPITHA